MISPWRGIDNTHISCSFFMCAYVHIFNQKLINFSGLYAPELTNGKVTNLNLVSRAADYFRLDRIRRLSALKGLNIITLPESSFLQMN